ncbi:MAG: hypothetical protein M3277_11920 [Actinomycetota bacterium]|nr:hypothetical protein [Actinomycetota bacterium]
MLFLLGINVWGLRLFGEGINYTRWGTMGDWAANLATLLAVTVAFHGIRQERRDRWNELALREEKERTQVYCWMTLQQEETSATWFIEFNNMTPTPVRAWVLRVTDDADSGELVLSVADFGVLLPGMTKVATEIEPQALSRPECQLDFVDSSGACWRRTPRGDLQGIDDVTLNTHILASKLGNGQVDA